MKSDKKDSDNKDITLVSIPGLSIKMDKKADFVHLKAHGPLRKACAPFLKRINERLKEEKPAFVDEDKVIASTWLPPIPSKAFNRLLLAETQIALGRYIPETVSFEITRNCKCDCEHCVVSGGEGDLDIDTVKRAIDDVLDMGAMVIVFTEGDPMLREDIYELIDYVDKERAIVNMYTPGTEMTPENARRLKEAGLHNLLISVYSTEPEKHDAVRRLDGAYEMATNAMKMGLDAGLLVTMTTHVSPKNIDELPAMYELAKEIGVHEFSLWESVPKKKGDAIISDDDRKKVLEMYHRINSTKGGPRIFANTYFEGEMLGCMAGQRWLNVCVDGLVKPCCYIPFHYGNIQESSVKDIWTKIRKDKHFRGQRSRCLMQETEYLQLVDKIPEDASKPYDIDKLEV
ncbi:radical SAM/SPASM domain-containing protein [Methanolobus profundi]|uniref:Radical SAM superfamily enzyme, MoaA/NifB/PqqE/SkfB family n=1 Tax=Methanolobus profundi TaxID=487685 RepID=A0A1I4QWV9_9EURY|nr:radical SAM protein [Methanolobus profundi]SFM44538.1 Radical SAM superfamily enzyme, MoaA/NifB/PqqE/SkfB family [Methanolobus profundi]